jgi:hypothetical protein
VTSFEKVIVAGAGFWLLISFMASIGEATHSGRLLRECMDDGHPEYVCYGLVVGGHR